MRLQNIRAVEFAARIFNPYKIFATRKYDCPHHHFLSAFSLCGGDNFLTMMEGVAKRRHPRFFIRSMNGSYIFPIVFFFFYFSFFIFIFYFLFLFTPSF